MTTLEEILQEEEPSIERKELVKWSLRRLREQRSFTAREVKRNEEVITEKWSRATTADVEQYLTRRRNLRLSLAMMELAEELFTAEQKRLKEAGDEPTKAS